MLYTKIYQNNSILNVCNFNYEKYTYQVTQTSSYMIVNSFILYLIDIIKFLQGVKETISQEMGLGSLVFGDYTRDKDTSKEKSNRILTLVQYPLRNSDLKSESYYTNFKQVQQRTYSLSKDKNNNSSKGNVST